MRLFSRLSRTLFITILLLGLLGGGIVGGLLYYLIVVNPGPEMDEKYIASILGRESPVFYNNGQDKIGVLFQEAHRQYIEYKGIPQSFINAIVAAEDATFFHHFGIDLPGIVRAMIVNFKAGRIVQGGSTITQQTAKNLFKRESRSYQAKLKELLYALRLEYHFPKEKILEFYSNQFYVSGNGHGLGVAARYYFDKTPAELSLLESAFIAGSVKRPNYYNPFIKKDKESVELTRQRANQRATYVLNQMYKHDLINQTEYTRSLVAGLTFKQGRMSFDLNTLMDLVKEGLNSATIKNRLEDNGISNVSTSGVRIITTVDKDLQRASLSALRCDLSRLDVRLRGYQRDEVLKEYSSLRFDGDHDLSPSSFLFGRILQINSQNSKQPAITVDLGAEGKTGIIDRQGLDQTLTALVRYRRQSWDTASDKDLPILLKELQVGDPVFVSVREIAPDETPMLELHRFPELQGAAMVLQRGAIRAMAGGVENKFYNRAIHAKRLMGSTFKPFLFSAALQLGWNSTDVLDNRHNVFVFQRRPYFPRPDHNSPFDRVSMSWAGIKSENLAAVWLLYHLTDRLTPPEVRDLADHLDMAPLKRDGVEESYKEFSTRLRNRFGININGDLLEMAAYELAVRNMESDMLFEGRDAEYTTLQNLPYGQGFARFRADLLQQLSSGGLDDQERKALHQHLGTLGSNYLELRPTANALRLHSEQRHTRQAEAVDAMFQQPTVPIPPDNLPRGLFFETASGRIGFTLRGTPAGAQRPLGEAELRAHLDALSPGETAAFWDNILIEGQISSYMMQEVARRMEQELQQLAAKKPYSMEVLPFIRDYRLMLGLQYLIHLAREAGATSPLEPVLSFPLGSNVISLNEAVSIYETMVTGSRFETDKQPEHGEADDEDNGADPAGLAVIERIETAEGKIIYQRQATPKLVYGPKNSLPVASVLQNTIQYGTGNHAFKEVRLHSDDPARTEELKKYDLPIPLLGKTGTANDYRNSAFFGFVPILDDRNRNAMILENGYTVGVYVGFDDNQPMVRRSTRISGSLGSLGIWSMIAQSILDQNKTGDRIDTVDLEFNGLSLRYPEAGQIFIAADANQGGAIGPGSTIIRDSLAPMNGLHILSFGTASPGERFEPDRTVNPFWKNQAGQPGEQK